MIDDQDGNFPIEGFPFVRAGEWLLRMPNQRPTKSGLYPSLVHPIKDKRVLYAFVVSGRPQYIGVCKEKGTTLKDRMDRYQNIQGGSPQSNRESTNQRIARLIRERLEASERVEICAYRPEPIPFGQLLIDPILSLEDALIACVKLPWNR